MLKKEFKGRLSKDYDIYEDDKISVGYKFVIPEVNRDLRSEKPFKTVKTEYWIISGVSLIGSIGGTLGLFVSFSFIDILKWMILKVFRVHSICKKKE